MSLENHDEIKKGSLDVLDWLRSSRAASFHAEKFMIECMMAYAEGKNPLEPMRAGSHFIKKARECFNSAVEVCNYYCRHSYEPGAAPKEYDSANAGQRPKIEKEEAERFLEEVERAGATEEEQGATPPRPNQENENEFNED